MRALLALLIVLATTRGALAGSRPPGRTQPLDVEVHVVTERYTNETVAADLLALGVVMVASAVVGDDGEENTAVWTTVALSGVVYALGAPYVHLRNDNESGAIASLGLRVVLPSVAGYLLYDASGGDCDDECDSDLAAAGGVMLGVVTAMVVDHATLSKKRVKRTVVYGGLTSSVHLTDERVSLSLGGSF